MKLSELQINQKAIICQLDIENLPCKLTDIGFLPGCQIELILKAPLGDPLYLKVEETHLCIRKDMAMQIDVELLNGQVHAY